MKILAVSDIHLKDFEVPSGSEGSDYLIVAGDLANSGTVDELKSAVDIILNKASLLNIPKIIITAGNHDNALETEIGLKEIEEYLILKADSKKVSALIVIDDLIVLHNGLKVFVSPYYRPIGKFFGFHYTPEMQKQLFDNIIPKDIDMLVTHGPQFGVLDGISSMWDDADSYGCKLLRDFLLQSKVKIHICGHIHESFGNTDANGLKTFNVATKAQLILIS